MAVQQYGQSTASNQNTYAQPQMDEYTTGQQQARPRSQQSANQWQITPNYGQQGNQYTSAWSQPQTRTAQSQPQTYTPSTMTPWNQPTPTAPQSTPGQQATTQTWATPQAWTPAQFNTQALRDQNTAYMQATLPYQQFLQNNQQYTTDFNEAQRRWDSQNGWQQQMDTYNMGLTGRQQTFNEWQAQEAANQWGAQFGWQQQNDMFSQGLAQQQQAIDQAYNEGRLSNEQRQIALGELTQQQQNAYQYANLAATQGWNREELAATNAYRQQQDALARWQQQQQMAMQQAELAAARQNAVLQATGRSMGNGPSATWMRRF